MIFSLEVFETLSNNTEGKVRFYTVGLWNGTVASMYKVKAPKPRVVWVSEATKSICGMCVQVVGAAVVGVDLW